MPARCLAGHGLAARLTAAPGSRETVIVTQGAVSFSCDGAEHDLQAGDAVTFDADLPHHFENEGEDATRFLAVIAAGLRRS